MSMQQRPRRSDILARLTAPNEPKGQAQPVTVTLAAQAEIATEIAERFDQLGWRVRRVQSLDGLEQGQSDVVIAGHGFGGAGVDELCARALSAPSMGGSPLAVVIGAPQEQRLEYLRAGADDAMGTDVGADEVVARLQALLRRVRVERDCSPLTGLPGNTRFEQVLRDRLAAGETPAVLMLDIDNFKAFNDRYGHWRGDRVIKMLAEIVRRAAERSPEAFVAHVGGDDFLVISSPALVDEIAEECQADFDARAPKQYDESDRLRGYVTTRSRAGRRQQFRLMTLTLAAATAEAEDMQHIGQFFQVLAELKEYAKNHAGSTYVKDRRHNHGWRRE